MPGAACRVLQPGNQRLAGGVPKLTQFPVLKAVREDGSQPLRTLSGMLTLQLCCHTGTQSRGTGQDIIRLTHHAVMEVAQVIDNLPHHLAFYESR